MSYHANVTAAPVSSLRQIATGKTPSFEFDAATSAKSRAAMQAFVKQTGAQLWIEHDKLTHAEWDLIICDEAHKMSASYFGGALASALEFRNVGYLAADMEWIRFLLTKPGLPFQSPREYFMTYADALREVMGSRGNEIADQLERYVEHA